MGDYRERFDKKLLPFNTSSAKNIVDRERAEAENRGKPEIAKWGINKAADIMFNIPTTADVALRDHPKEVALAYKHMLAIYDEQLPNGTRNGIKRAAGAIATDPLSWLSVGSTVLLKGLLSATTKEGTKKLLMNRLGTLAGGSAIMGTEAASIGTLHDLMTQYIEAGGDPYKTDWLRTAIAGGMGFTAGGLLTATIAGGIPGLVNMIRNAGKSGTALRSGIGPVPEEGRRRIGTTGQYIGAPPGVKSQQMLGALRNRVRNLAKEGAEGRLWYERSSREILEVVNGDVDEADKLIQAIAVTSPGTPVKSNFDYALQAYSQWKAGEPIKTGRFATDMSKKLEQIFNGQQWDGRKTDDFYNNLMIHIDPNRTGPVTGDIWMLRAFGFTKPNEMPSPRQYDFITKETQKIADDFGWEPHQVQAAIWVTMKGRAENPGVKKATEASSLKKGWIKFEVNERTGKKERVVIDHENHMKNWLKHALKHNLTEADIDRAKFDYADAIADNSGQISWESKKGRTSNNMPELFDAPWKQQSEYHVAISKVFLDENGDDIIAKRLGILSPRDFEAPGFFEGVTSPGTQTIALMPRQYKGKSTGSIEKANNNLIAAYAAVRGILLNQDGVGWHRPFHKARKMDENGISIDIGRPFSREETTRLGDILRELSGHDDFNPIASENGVRLINFDFTRRVPDGKKGFKPAQADTWIDHDKLLTNDELKKLVDNALDKLKLDDEADANLIYFHSYNGYSANDWKVNKNGEGYLKAIGGAGRSDLQRLVRDLIEEFQPKVDEVDQSFAGQYGWTINDAINANYRKQSDEVVDVGKAEGGTKAKSGDGQVDSQKKKTAIDSNINKVFSLYYGMENVPPSYEKRIKDAIKNHTSSSDDWQTAEKAMLGPALKEVQKIWAELQTKRTRGKWPGKINLTTIDGVASALKQKLGGGKLTGNKNSKYFDIKDVGRVRVSDHTPVARRSMGASGNIVLSYRDDGIQFSSSGDSIIIPYGDKKLTSRDGLQEILDLIKREVDEE